MKTDAPGALLEELAKRFAAREPLAGEASPRETQGLAAVALLVRRRLSAIARLLDAGDSDDEAAILTRTLFEWAVVAVYLADDDPEERVKRRQRFADFGQNLMQHAVETVANKPATDDIRQRATTSPEAHVLRTKADVAADRSEGTDFHLVFRALFGKSLKDHLAGLPDGETWTFLYEHAYFDLSTVVHPSPRQLLARRHASWPWAVATYAAIFARTAIAAACSVAKLAPPDVVDIVERLAHGSDHLPQRPPRPSLAMPDPASLEAVCQPFHVKGLALFGSAVHSELSWASDVDLLVEFEPGTRVSLFTLSDLEHRLSSLFQRTVDLVIKSTLRKELRDQILREARPLYGAI